MAVGVPVPVNALGVPIKRAASAAAAARGGAWVAATPSGGRGLLSASPPSPPGEREALRRVGARLRSLGRSAADAQRVVEGVAAELAGKDDVARGRLLDEVGEYLAHEEFMVNERRVTPRGLRSRNFSPPSPSAGGDYDDDEYDGSWRPTADEVEARWAEALGRLPDDEAAAVHARWAAGSASSPGAGPSSDVGVVALADVRDPTGLFLDELARARRQRRARAPAVGRFRSVGLGRAWGTWAARAEETRRALTSLATSAYLWRTATVRGAVNRWAAIVWARLAGRRATSDVRRRRAAAETRSRRRRRRRSGA